HEIIKKRTHDTDFVILDIRTPAEFKAGHLQNSISLDYYSTSFAQQLKKLDKSKTYLVYCRSGNRSGKALPLFRKMAFNKVYEMGRGINGWLAAGLPVVQ
ncbi:MAG: rhodanese-like domain-containing protein, partial [Desulfobacterales bacterium]